MNTQCPHCRTVFRIEQAQLDAAGGRVRCGHCRRIFDARARLQQEPPLAPGSPQGGMQPGLGLGEPPSGTISGVLASDFAAKASVKHRSRRALAGWAAANAVLVIMLCVQLLFVQRDVFAQDPTLRPVLERLCAVAECTLPQRQALDRIELLRRNVYAHPNREDALLIDATMVNNARFAQPFPVLTVALGDRQGQALSRRNFEPREYLADLPPDARMVPGLPVRLTLELHAPEHAAHTYEFGFVSSG